MAGSIWAKLGEAVKKGAGATRKVFLLLPKALIYPIRKPFASIDEMKHDFTVSLKEAISIDVPKEEKGYDPPIETTEASKYLGVQITEQKKGKVTFLASRTLTGDVPYLTSEQLGKIKDLSKDRPSNLTLFREENKIVIEVDVEAIIKKAKKDNPGMGEKTIKQLVIDKIYDEVDHNLKGLAKITGGEFKIHTDRKLLHGVAEKLYKEYDNQKQSSEIMKSTGPVNNEKLQWRSPGAVTSTDEFIKSFNMTNPSEFPFVKEKKEVITNVQLQSTGLRGLNLENVSGEAIRPISTPNVKSEERGKGSRS
ncbi:hypothetical protein [Wolbachia pipientis]|uniref:hypothetical protein n=1 Tax=Wolbachia pipientis TaxID=955 RepID=UPI0025A4B09E|nr:hypothetical protein [Wolbachia pipientis]MDM8335246.1 hypothetical protein [Wolbachia pipientis]